MNKLDLCAALSAALTFSSIAKAQPAQDEAIPPATETALAPGAESAGAAAKSEEPAKPKGQAAVYLGVAISPLDISGLKNIHVSDWENFSGTNEGRIALPLDKGNTSGTHVGVRGGFRLGSALPFLAEVGVFPGDATLVTLGIGADLHPLKTDWFSIGICPKIGYLLGIVDAGKAEVLPGKTPPIITPRGTFNEGDAVSGMFSGAFGQIGASAMLQFTKRLGLRLDAGYQLAWVADFKIKAGDVELENDDPALVRNDGSSTPAGLDPEAKSTGPYALAAVTFKL